MKIKVNFPSEEYDKNILEDKISTEKMSLVKKEMELLKISIIPETHIIDDIYYQRLRSQKNYNAKKMSNQ